MKLFRLTGSFSDEQALLQALQRGDRKAEEYLYKKYKQQIINMVLKNNGTKADAEDLYQQVMLDVMEDFANPDFVLTSKIGTFIFKVAENQWRNRLRKKRDIISIGKDDGEENQNDITSILEKQAHKHADESNELREEQLRLLRHALSQISEECRQMLDAWYARDWGTSDQLAKRFNKSNGEVLRKSVHRCREKLRQIFIPLWNKQL